VALAGVGHTAVCSGATGIVVVEDAGTVVEDRPGAVVVGPPEVLVDEVDPLHPASSTTKALHAATCVHRLIMGP